MFYLVLGVIGIVILIPIMVKILLVLNSWKVWTRRIKNKNSKKSEVIDISICEFISMYLFWWFTCIKKLYSLSFRKHKAKKGTGSIRFQSNLFSDKEKSKLFGSEKLQTKTDFAKMNNAKIMPDVNESSRGFENHSYTSSLNDELPEVDFDYMRKKPHYDSDDSKKLNVKIHSKFILNWVAANTRIANFNDNSSCVNRIVLFV